MWEVGERMSSLQPPSVMRCTRASSFRGHRLD